MAARKLTKTKSRSGSMAVSVDHGVVRPARNDVTVYLGGGLQVTITPEGVIYDRTYDNEVVDSRSYEHSELFE